MTQPSSPVGLSGLPWLASQLTVDTAINERARIHPQRTALVQGEQRLSYGALQARVNRLCRALQRLGIQRQDRIAVLAENRLEYAQTLLAAQSDATFVSLSQPEGNLIILYTSGTTGYLKGAAPSLGRRCITLAAQLLR
jgi:acyl-CoA synthetase (AMP-forming)/AMP-acid ligase II